MLRLTLVFTLILGLTELLAQPLTATWARRVGDNTQYVPSADGTAIDDQGNVFALFRFGDSITVDPSGANASYQGNFPNGNTWHSLLMKYDASGQYLWHRAWMETRMNDLKIDEQGNIYTLVRHQAGLDLDPGAGTVIASQSGLAMVKLSNQGDYLWHYSVSGSWFSQLSLQAGLELADDGAVYLNSTFSTGAPSSFDFDPGPAVVTLSPNLANRSFLVRLDTAGQFQWAKLTGGVMRFSQGKMTAGLDGKLYLLGAYREDSDFDPGPGTFQLDPPMSTRGMFVQCLDSLGNLVWVKGFTSPSPNLNPQPIYPYDLQSDSSGNVYVVGGFEGQIDFDPSSGTQILPSSSGTIDVFALKLDSNGDLAWAYGYGGASGDHVAHGVEIGPDQNVYIHGSYQDQIDVDPGPGTVTLSNTEVDGQYAQKLSAEGYLIWGHNILTGATNTQIPLVSMAVSHSDQLLLAGPYWDISSDFDPGAGQLNLPNADPYSNPFISIWEQDSCASFGLGIDSLEVVSCTSGTGLLQGAVSGGLSPHTYAWETSPPTFSSALTVDSAGLYTLWVADATGCSRETQVWVDGPMNSSGFDLKTNLIASHGLRAGFGSWLTLDAYNQGCTPVSGTLKLILDSDVTLDSVQPAPTQIVGDTLFWDFTNLTFDSGHLIKQIYLTPDTNLAIGHALRFPTKITPILGDAVPADNDREYWFSIIGSFDPNDKQVYPRGVCEEGFVEKDQPLTYTVRFQNTGNAEAIFVEIRDTLSQALDIGSLQVVAQSHEPMYAQVLEDNVLRFRFDDIMLPDSASDPAGSMGYVVFELTPKENLPNGTPVTNRAAIYFDFNEPIITNMVRNTLVDEVPGPELGPQAAAIQQSYNTLMALAEGFSYQWMHCDGAQLTPLSGETERQFTTDVSGTYALVVSNGACKDTSVCISLNVTPLAEQPNWQPKLFPNPSRGQLWISFGDNPTALSATLYDPLGQVVRRYHATPRRRHQLTLPPTPGVYLLHVQDGEQAYRYRIWRQ